MNEHEAPRAFIPQTPPLQATFYWDCPGKGMDGRETDLIVGWEWLGESVDDDIPEGWWPVVVPMMGHRTRTALTKKALGHDMDDRDRWYCMASPAQVIRNIPFDIHWPDA